MYFFKRMLKSWFLKTCPGRPDIKVFHKKFEKVLSFEEYIENITRYFLGRENVFNLS